MIARIPTQRLGSAARRSFHSSSKICTKDVPKAPPKAPPSFNNATRQQQQHQSQDPHQLASDMVKNASDSRISGTEALSALTPQQKMRNYSTALGLVAFCTGVWYYSISAVGQADGGIDELRSEAQEARDNLGKKSVEEMNAEELASLDDTADEIAQQEEELIITGNSGNEKKAKRPMWKKVLLFWKKE